MRLRYPHLDENYDKTRQVGCIGCLMYIFLFFTVGGVIILLGYPRWIMASVAIMAIFVVIWYISILIAYRSDQKKNQNEWFFQSKPKK